MNYLPALLDRIEALQGALEFEQKECPACETAYSTGVNCTHPQCNRFKNTLAAHGPSVPLSEGE